MNTNCIGNFHFKYLGMEEGYLGKKSSGFFYYGLVGKI